MKNRRILIVDDNRAIHADFRKILGKKRDEDPQMAALAAELFGDRARTTIQYELDSAYQGEEALALVQARLAQGERYALAFVDMRMPPGWDGVQTIANLWEIDPEIQVVICSAHSDSSWDQIRTCLGETDRLLILKKPFETAEVCQLACALTEKWELSRQAALKLSQLEGMVGEKTRELTLTNAQLQASKERYALAAAAANDGLWDWDLVADTLYYAPRWKAMLGLREDEVGNRSSEWFERVHLEDRDELQAKLAAHLAGSSDQFECEYRARHSDGQYRWMLCRGLAVRNDSGKAIRLAGSQTDINDRRLAEAQLRHDALHDTLTGLANRALFLDRLNQCVQRARRQPQHRFAVLFVDLDRFKLINDTFGHGVGDELLVGIAKRLVGSVRSVDSVVGPTRHNSVARLGGDEFVLLLDGLRTDADALRVAERLKSALSEPFVIGGKELFASMSIGIALGRPDYDKPEDIMRDADTALYQAKAQGRNCYQVFDSTMHASAMSRWWLENELRRAIERRELSLNYQPIFDVATGALKEFEALLRWKHSERGFISPAEFIPIAEDTGLIMSLGEWVIEEAARQLRTWDEQGLAPASLSIAVNVSGKQFANPNLVDDVVALLLKVGVDPSRIKLEVTESALMEKGLTAHVLERLKGHNLKLHLDDFGTGYSSLSYLHRIPVEALKIDRTFINEMARDHVSASIVQSIVSLARVLDIQVIAEGVETRAQLETLRQLECDSAQGYFLARPLTAEKATELLAGAAALPEAAAG
jgi:diguanylate cyclase (GGDEF)-like protein/PAS domain S-box-containing protein